MFESERAENYVRRTQKTPPPSENKYNFTE